MSRESDELGLADSFVCGYLIGMWLAVTLRRLQERDRARRIARWRDLPDFGPLPPRRPDDTVEISAVED